MWLQNSCQRQQPPQKYCKTGSINNLVATGKNLKWYASAASTAILPSTTAFVKNTTYYVSQTMNGIESSRTAVLVLEETPEKPTIKKGTNNLLTASTTPLGGSYQWYYNGTLLTGSTSKELIPTKDGNYTVIAIAPGGC